MSWVGHKLLHGSAVLLISWWSLRCDVVIGAIMYDIWSVASVRTIEILFLGQISGVVNPTILYWW